MSECGTTGGYQAHRRAHEPTCAPCRAAAAADRRYRVAYDYLTGGQKMLIGATGTRRRVRALCRIGWPLSVLAERLGVSLQNVAALTRREQVRRTTAEKVTALYDELSMTPGPSRSAALRAQAKGWPPPLAWNDDEIDSPTARPEPSVDWSSRRYRNPDLDEQILRLTRAGLSAAEIALRLRTYKRHVQRVRARHRDEERAS